jgi:hypothetical protein
MEVAEFDDFTTYNASLWTYDNGKLGTTDGCKVYYLQNHSNVGATLSGGEGTGLQMVMSDVPCKINPTACKGAKMAADHLTSHRTHLYGDYELRMRAPYTQAGSGGDVSNGTYAYFTAGYINTNGKWNEMNFGFHPDRDYGGTHVSCEHHDDTGGYKEKTVSIGGGNYREAFNTFTIRHLPGTLAWMVNNKTVRCPACCCCAAAAAAAGTTCTCATL